jgi:hypothetical protein
MDGKGFAFGQRPVAAFLHDATDSMLVLGTLPPMSRAQADQAYNDYPAMVYGKAVLKLTIDEYSIRAENWMLVKLTIDIYHTGEHDGQQDGAPHHAAANRRGSLL